ALVRSLHGCFFLLSSRRRHTRLVSDWSSDVCSSDLVRGISKAEPSNIALLVLAVLLYGTLVLPERRSGHVIMLLVGLFAAAMPVIHMRGAHYGEIARSTGGFFFVWTLWALGGLGGVTFMLSARGLWSLRRGQPR